MKTSTQRLIVITVFTLLVVLGLNALTQPREETLSAFPRGVSFYADYTWYLDDIVGPTCFAATALALLFQVCLVRKQPRRFWPVLILALAYGGFAFGDTLDLHWVFTAQAQASNQAKSFGSFGSKVLTVLVMGFGLAYAYDRFRPAALKAALCAFLIVLIDMVMLSVSLEFAGYAFHVFEEAIEAVAGLFLLLGVAPAPLIESA